MGKNIPEMRHQTCDRIFAALNHPLAATAHRPQEALIRVTKSIEKSCFDEACVRIRATEDCVDSNPQFSHVYHCICYVVCANLNATQSTACLERLDAEPAFCEQMGRAEERDFDPAPTQVMYDYLLLQRAEAVQEIRTTMLYPCSKCKGPTSSRAVQTRGADEEQTIFTYCPKCMLNGRGR